jgi:hypothetical protein
MVRSRRREVGQDRPKLNRPIATSSSRIGRPVRFAGIVSSPEFKNISLYRNSDLRYMSAPARATVRDVSRSSRNVVRVAMGRCRRQVTCAPGETSAADGEIVWSWRRDPGATSVGSNPSGNGGKKGRSPGRVRISRQTIARGRPGCPGCTCQIRVRFLTTLAHGAAGAAGARPSPRPLIKREQTKSQNPDENESRE